MNRAWHCEVVSSIFSLSGWRGNVERSDSSSSTLPAYTSCLPADRGHSTFSAMWRTTLGGASPEKVGWTLRCGHDLPRGARLSISARSRDVRPLEGPPRFFGRLSVSIGAPNDEKAWRPRRQLRIREIEATANGPGGNLPSPVPWFEDSEGAYRKSHTTFAARHRQKCSW